MKNCPACNSRHMYLYADNLFDDRYGYPGYFALVKCKSCGQIETNPAISEERLAALYSNYYPRHEVDVGMLASQVRRPWTLVERLGRWINGTNNQGQYLAEPGTKVLDYGCGTGVSLLELRQRQCEGFGVEHDPNIEKIAQHFGLKVHIGSLADKPFPGIKFDLIVLNQVIEHLLEPGRLLERLSDRLSSEGKIILSFPNTGSIYRWIFNRHWINWHVPYHLNHFSRQSFELLCNRLGLRCTRWRTVTPNFWTFLQVRTWLHPGSPGIPNEIWVGKLKGNSAESSSIGDSSRPRRGRILKSAVGSLVGRVMLVIGIVSVTLVNRIVDLVGLGDSLVVTVQLRERP